MKHQFRKSITTIIMCLLLIFSTCPVMAKSKPTSGKWRKNVSWNYDKKTATLTVSGTGYMDNAGNDDGDNPGWQCWSSQVKKIVITGSLKDIGECAFWNFEKVKIVEMCDSITKVEACAFERCVSLKTIKLSKNLKKIGESAFSSTAIKQITLPESVRNIGTYAFEGCTKLEKINLPSGITKISRDTFWYCKKLKSITLPSNLTEIGEYAFEATGIENITIPSKVKVIGKGVFSYCSHLKNVNIKSKKISEIGMDAFVDVSAKAKITVPKSKYAFYCELLKKSGMNRQIKVNGKKQVNKKLNGENSAISWKFDKENYILTVSGNGDIQDFMNDEEQNAFFNDEDFLEPYEIVIEEGITSIGDKAFWHFNKLKSVTLPSTLTSIGDYAFYGCGDLQKITLPDNLEQIGEGAFAYSGIKKISIPEKVTCVGKYAFAGCNRLSDVGLPASLNKICWGTFWKCEKLKSINLPADLKEIEDYAFYGSGIKKLTVPDGVKVGKNVLRDKK